MRIWFLGAAGTVTGSCFLVEAAGKKIMVDCGLFQGSKEIKERNYGDFPFPPKGIDHVVLTHAHIDHAGLIPKLCRLGYRGKITATEATVDLCRVLLPDSGHIQEMEIERKNRKSARAGRKFIEPIYTVQQAIDSMRQFQGAEYEQEIVLEPGITVRFRDAGHILGSAMLEMRIVEGGRETRIVFSGDIGNLNQPLIQDPTQIESADYLVMESTYGNRLHEETEDKVAALQKVITETYKKGGNLIIPAFAVERTQDLLYDLHQLQAKGQMPPMDIYIDSPLAVAVTEIFRENIGLCDGETKELINRGDDPLGFPKLKFSRTTEESKALNERRGGAIIISASGMCDAGRVKHHLKHNLWRPESTVLFVGYQAEGTLGRRILDGEMKVTIHGEMVAVKAAIRKIEGFSAHADSRHLLAWVQGFRQKPVRTFVVHGEPAAAANLADEIRNQVGIDAVVPQWLSTYDLVPAATEPVAVGPGTASTEKDLEQAYSSLCSEIRQIVDQGITSGDNGSAWEQLKRIKRVLKGNGSVDTGTGEPQRG